MNLEEMNKKLEEITGNRIYWMKLDILVLEEKIENLKFDNAQLKSEIKYLREQLSK